MGLLMGRRLGVGRWLTVMIHSRGLGSEWPAVVSNGWQHELAGYRPDGMGDGLGSQYFMVRLVIKRAS